MNENSFLKRAAELGTPVLEYEPLSRYTTFRIGGPARFLARPAGPAALRALRLAAAECGLPCVILGNGSNLLAADEGYPGVVLRTPDGPAVREGDVLRVPAGALLSRAAQTALEQGLTGLEFAHGIPGTAGGAAVMNAGAYGGEIAQVLCGSAASDETGRAFDLGAAEHAFGYRRSVYTAHPDWLCESVSFALTPGDPAAIRARMDELAARRREKQPLEYPSAGSVYKRPEGHFAGRLIEDCGLKGRAVGGAQVSEKHAGFIINTGDATCADVLALMALVEKAVYERFGVRLEREIRLLK